MRTVLISGHFDPFHQAHLDFIKKAAGLGDCLICLVSRDKQVIMKKGKVNIPELYRAEIVELILEGLKLRHQVLINVWDKETASSARALKVLHPTIFCRGTDKTEIDFPADEREVCEDLGIQVVYAPKLEAHGSEFKWMG